MSKRILVVEDDPELGGQIAKRLRTAGYDPLWWQEGRLVLRDDLVDVELVILDLMLPGTYGLDLLKSLRACSDVPVLVLSARNDTTDKVRALQLGADDYMTKPFWPDELIERVKARLRRPQLERQTRFELGSLRIDHERREVFVRAERIELTRLEFNLLAALAERHGAAVTRRWLVEHVLDADSEDSERTLNVHVSRLRKKLGRGGDCIETVWGIGYRLSEGSRS